MTVNQLEALMEVAANAPEVTVKRNKYGYRVDGEYFRRVTTFCGGIPKPWLGMWAAKEVAEFAYNHRDAWEELPKTDAVKLLKGAPWSKRDDAADRGTAIHNAIEASVQKRSLPEGMSEEELSCAQSAMKFIQERDSQILAIEMIVFNRTIGYAGTLDMWEIDAKGNSWILDWKTSGDIYVEHAIQQAAYRNAEFAVVQTKKHPTKEQWTGKVIPFASHMAERLGIVHVKDDGVALYPIRYSDRLWSVFRAAAHVKMFQLDTDSYKKEPRTRVFDTPVLTPA